LRATTIEATSKRWKLISLVSGLAAVLGILLYVVGLTQQSFLAIFGLIIFGLSFIGAVVGQVGAWWENK
jgi:small-conductance mechanosensitive channel